MTVLSPRSRRALLAWFDRSARELPWRANRDPYRIWVSEVMLQQTQVSTVIPFFERFLQRFPTLHELASAKEQEVLRYWEGLGYYRRAKHLHQAACKLVEDHEGQIPDDPATIAQLPGVGRYILGAVLSQAFDRRLPILEANTKRVFCRLLGLEQDPALGEVQRQLWEFAETILPRRRAGDFNQALMELGAMVCTPTNPGCPNCPLQTDCSAFASGSQERIPLRRLPVAPQSVREAAVVVRKGNKVLLLRRPDHGRWANMWEFPHLEMQDRETHESAISRILRDLVGLDAELREPILTVHHTVTRFRISMDCWEADYRSGKWHSPFYVAARWLIPAKLREYPVSRPQRQLAEVIAAPIRQRTLFFGGDE